MQHSRAVTAALQQQLHRHRPCVRGHPGESSSRARAASRRRPWPTSTRNSPRPSQVRRTKLATVLNLFFLIDHSLLVSDFHSNLQGWAVWAWRRRRWCRPWGGGGSSRRSGRSSAGASRASSRRRRRGRSSAARTTTCGTSRRSSPASRASWCCGRCTRGSATPASRTMSSTRPTRPPSSWRSPAPAPPRSSSARARPTWRSSTTPSRRTSPTAPRTSHTAA